jgi:hypothetical protein
MWLGLTAPDQIKKVKSALSKFYDGVDKLDNFARGLVPKSMSAPTTIGTPGYYTKLDKLRAPIEKAINDVTLAMIDVRQRSEFCLAWWSHTVRLARGH